MSCTDHPGYELPIRTEADPRPEPRRRLAARVAQPIPKPPTPPAETAERVTFSDMPTECDGVPLPPRLRREMLATYERGQRPDGNPRFAAEHAEATMRQYAADMKLVSALTEAIERLTGTTRTCATRSSHPRVATMSDLISYTSREEELEDARSWVLEETQRARSKSKPKANVGNNVSGIQPAKAKPKKARRTVHHTGPGHADCMAAMALDADALWTFERNGEAHRVAFNFGLAYSAAKYNETQAATGKGRYASPKEMYNCTAIKADELCATVASTVIDRAVNNVVKAIQHFDDRKDGDNPIPFPKQRKWSPKGRHFAAKRCKVDRERHLVYVPKTGWFDYVGDALPGGEHDARFVQTDTGWMVVIKDPNKRLKPNKGSPVDAVVA